MNICIIRHGETDWNKEKRLQGREDIPLNENGILQAEQCAHILKVKKWDAIISSTLSRAKQTSKRISDILNISEITEDADLDELDMGKASGLTYAECKKLYPDGNVEGMEDRQTFKERVCNAVKKYAEIYNGGDIIIVSHGGAINSFLAEMSGNTIGSGKTKLQNACINLFEYNDGKFKIIFYNKRYNEINF